MERRAQATIGGTENLQKAPEPQRDQVTKYEEQK
jgi:hypothetical protein